MNQATGSIEVEKQLPSIDSHENLRILLNGRRLPIEHGEIKSLVKANFKERHLLIGNKFQRPSHYIQYEEPLESELAERVEYDMDEHDFCWTKEYKISHDLFEKVMDKCEKEWFDLTNELLRTSEPVAHEESVCDICNDGECENSNAIVFCDGCELAVHQECYGVPYIPEGSWLCRKCLLRPEAKSVDCVFCPNKGGAFKQTTSNQWVHLLCGMWIPECSITNPVYMEPLEVEKVPKERWKLKCSICKIREGACIQCFKKNCVSAFHVTCARKANLYMKIKYYTNKDYSVHKCFCPKHAPVNGKKISSKMNIRVTSTSEDHSDSEEEEGGLLREELEDDRDKNNCGTHNNAHNSQTPSITDSSANISGYNGKGTNEFGFNPLAPVINEFIFERIVQLFKKKKKEDDILNICKYWALKRETKRGAPLLKRLHIEPWTAYTSTIQESEMFLKENFRKLTHVRKDLEKVRLLVDLVKKREKTKFHALQFQFDYLKIVCSPLTHILKKSVEEVKR